MGSETIEENENETYEVEEVIQKRKLSTDMNYKHKFLVPHVIVHSLLQIGWLIGIYTALFHSKLATILWGFLVAFLSIEGVALAAHRDYSHRSYKPRYPLKVGLVIFQTMAGQNSMFTWARDHKLHHKYSDTDADPHNSTRGFFFSHIGWLMMKKHPLLLQKQREIDVSDLLNDKLIMFQHRYFLYLYFPLAMFFPVAVPMYFWNESLWSSFFVAYCLRYVTTLHITWTINSFAHMWGSKPYDKRIRARESFISSLATLGEGFHNFHHSFPWDYRMTDTFSLSSLVLDLLAYLGLAYDLKVAFPSIVQGHIKRHGEKAGGEMTKEVIELKQERKEESVPGLNEKSM
ncbi:Acyl-CoA desaturase [Eufriesea mexicana]|uniref:Acyl-CoA desaturase n=1 Tax=Eufriesea mexicana TaxID=516756 RepID=A0A310SJ24_9HYME|nr:PREDICTED: (11Z)-hexadec-11-enoyl-CoA conjugase-like [Eufriesea mexicana]OAD53560.1 Acyl-CoA desaturase [Eufriesea mexicana]